MTDASPYQPLPSAMSPFRRRPGSVRPKKAETAARVAKIVGESLREYRRRQGHSLDTLALASGVSRAMLGQIETGKSVPTITVLWKIADALGVPVAQLVGNLEAPQFLVARRDEARPTATTAGRFESRPIAPADNAPDHTFSEIRIAAGHRETIAPRRELGRASLVVARGSVDIIIGDGEPVHLAEGDAIFFSAAIAHVIACRGDEDGILYLVVTSHRNGRP